MTSASKALSLLACFSTSRPEIGLSQLCRIAGRDKATTYRHLQALEAAGFIEQNPMTKHYRLGPAVLLLAQVREATVPRKEAAKAPLQKLANATGETAHVTVLSGTTLYGLCEFESPRHGTRAVIDLNTFPLHATASGLCALTFGDSELFDAALSNLESFTENTLNTAAELQALTDGFRKTGIARANRSYENEIESTAAALFDHAGHLIGTVAVACVASRFTHELEDKINAQLILASREITRNWGGSIPDNVESAWANTNTALPALETA